MFVDRMNRLVDQTELDNRTMILDEPRIRRAPGGSLCGRPPRNRMHSLTHRLDQNTGLRQKNIAGAGKPHIVTRTRSARGGIALEPHPVLETFAVP